MDSEQQRQFPWAIVAGVVVVGLVVAAVWFTSGSSDGSSGAPKLPFGPAEQAYAERVQFTDIKMSRATNFLDQEVTFIFGRVENRGTRPIRELDVAIEFRNLLDQVILRETRRVFDRRVPVLGGGMSREFQFNFERVPADWGQRPPSFRITGMSLEP